MFPLFIAFKGDRETSTHDIYFPPSHGNCPPPLPFRIHWRNILGIMRGR